MRTVRELNDFWRFTKLPAGMNISKDYAISPEYEDASWQPVELPHTYNSEDSAGRMTAADGEDYYRGTVCYRRSLALSFEEFSGKELFLEFEGANTVAEVYINGRFAGEHSGGYSAFRFDITDYIYPNKDNLIAVIVSNAPTDYIAPITDNGDFTKMGGLYRGVKLIAVEPVHIALNDSGSCGVYITPRNISETSADIGILVKLDKAETAEAKAVIYDPQGKPVTEFFGRADKDMITLSGKINCPKLWDGVNSPALYRAEITLFCNGKPVDSIEQEFGIRSYLIDADNGFFLNGKPYPLHGVSRHQDRKGLGNAITREMHDEDMALIRELGANTVRLAHYQHDQYFYDLCDKYGMVVWAEIPYISEHLPNGRENTISQMKELIHQNYNHPSIVCWGVSNEITISTKDKADMLDNHRVLNELCHKMDPTRLTTLACYAMCGPFNPVAHITDLVSWNLYLGWYVPGLFLNDLWMGFFHLVYPNRPLGFSEYGAEGMPNLHSAHPRRGDHTEEYQAKYHEYMLKCFDRHPWLWATHVWNMFDFAADARDQGGEPGMNHKGLVTFDRKTKKDSFYLYKAWWSEENFVHICSKRFTDRTEKEIEVKVYSNQKSVTLYADGKKLAEQTGEHIFKFRVPLHGKVELKAVAGDCIDTACFRSVAAPNPSYKLVKTKSKSANWV